MKESLAAKEYRMARQARKSAASSFSGDKIVQRLEDTAKALS